VSASPAELPRLTIKGVDHAFGGVHAVADVDLTFRGGEICALLGENGAGKSTLVKVVAGALRPDRGEVLLDGAPLPLGDPGKIRNRGVSLIYQELNLVESLPAYENIALGRESRRGPFVDREQERSEAEALLKDLDAEIDPALAVDELPVAQRQLVEIAKSLAVDARVLIMDEPTSSLSDREARRLFGIVKRLAGRGVSIIFITHRLDEVAELADRVVVMRDGAVVTDGPSGEFSESDLIKSMVGRPLDRQFPEHERSPGDVILQVAGLTVPPRVKNVGFELRRGEILALAGLVGSGRTDVGRALFGIDRLVAGAIRLDGRAVRFGHPCDAIRAGVGWVSEDRKGEGLVLGMSVLANLTLPHLASFVSVAGWIDGDAERRAAGRQIERLAIRTTGAGQEAAELSGGNQQKLAFARWLLRECRVLICDEPTRGVDVGGRYEIYELMEQLARRGVAVLMISSDMQEVLGMADRIVVMHEGRVSGELAAAAATQEQLLELAMGQRS
jgi:ABC-type sugar transport system ATPase subunit